MKIYKNARLYELPFGIEHYDGNKSRYYVTKKGDVFYGNISQSVEKINTYISGGRAYVQIFNKEYRLAKIILIAFIGDIDLDFYSDDEEYPTSRNTKYIIEDIVTTDDSIFIHGVEFKRIISFPRYFISSTGIVFDSKNWKFKLHHLNQYNYHVISVEDEFGNNKTPTIHRLVYLTWVGDIPEGMELDHLYCRSRNGVDDTELVDHYENVLRAHSAGCYSDHTVEDVIKVCELLQSGMKSYRICHEFGYYKGDPEYDRFLSFIYKIRNHESWNHISKNYKFPPTNIYGGRVHSDDKIRKICQMLVDGYTQKEIENVTGIKRQHISNIRQGKTRSNITKEYDFSKCRKRGQLKSRGF